jgi:hypothetical protein
MKFKSKCKCGWPFLPDNRHVDPDDGCVKDCKPGDNLELLEWKLEQKEQSNKRPKRLL